MAISEFQPPDAEHQQEHVEAPTLEDVMFAVFEYARHSDGIDSTEGHARVRQRERMFAKDRELRAMLNAMQTWAYADGRKDERENCDGDARRYRVLCSRPDWRFIEDLCLKFAAESETEFKSGMDSTIDALPELVPFGALRQRQHDIREAYSELRTAIGNPVISGRGEQTLHGQTIRAAVKFIGEISALLPGPYYMDPPDGGSVSVFEQFQRMAQDARRWREQQERIMRAIACETRLEG